MDWSLRVSGPVAAARSHEPDAPRCWAIVLEFVRHGPDQLDVGWGTLSRWEDGDPRTGPVSWLRGFRIGRDVGRHTPLPIALTTTVGGQDVATVFFTDPGPVLVDVTDVPAGRYRVEPAPGLMAPVDVHVPGGPPPPDVPTWQPPTLATAADGVRLIGVDPDPAWPRFIASLPFRDKSWSFALVVLRRGDDVLLVHDRFRDQWELPGGSREGDETPEQAARRELVEETGHAVDDLAFAAVVTLAKGPTGRRKRGFVYTANVPPDAAITFSPNEEIDAVRWWDGSDPSDGVAPAAIDAAIVRGLSPR